MFVAPAAPNIRFVSARIAAGDNRGVVRFVGGGVAIFVSVGGGCATVAAAAGVCSGALVRVTRGGSVTPGLAGGGVCACKVHTIAGSASALASLNIAEFVFTIVFIFSRRELARAALQPNSCWPQARS